MDGSSVPSHRQTSQSHYQQAQLYQHNAQDQQQQQSQEQQRQQQLHYQQQLQQPQPQPQQPLKQDLNPITNNVNSVMLEDTESIENGKVRFKKIFLTRKKSSVRAKEKKIRQNRQLRKAILPKNALMALHEVKGITISDFNVTQNPGIGGFTVIVTVNKKQYEGIGNSKIAAKNHACEKALRDYVIEKMVKKPRQHKNQINLMESMDTRDNISENDADIQKDTEEEDDVPMINLASFALFKLFTEWENLGYIVPEMHNSSVTNNDSNNTAPKEPKKAPIRNELPPNWETMHPATLLCVMRPGLTYIEYGTVGEKPNILQSVGVTVNEQEEVKGFGRSKKIARRNAAVTVCNQLFGTNFMLEEPSSVASN